MMNELKRDLLILKLNKVMSWNDDCFDITPLEACCDMFGSRITNFERYGELSMAHTVSLAELSFRGQWELKSIARDCLLWTLQSEDYEDDWTCIVDAVEWL